MTYVIQHFSEGVILIFFSIFVKNWGVNDVMELVCDITFHCIFNQKGIAKYMVIYSSYNMCFFFG